jgi:hypothetical protein
MRLPSGIAGACAPVVALISAYPRTVLPADQSYFALRLGRQEVDFGDERLLAVREGPNTLQSFDGARLILNSSNGRVDVFALRVDPDETGYFATIRVGVMRPCGESIQLSH